MCLSSVVCLQQQAPLRGDAASFGFVSENLSTFQTGTVDVTVALCGDNIHCIFVSVMFKTPADPFRNTFILLLLSITDMKSQQDSSSDKHECLCRSV